MAAETVLPATSMVKVHLYLKLAELTYKVCLFTAATAARRTQGCGKRLFGVLLCVSCLLQAFYRICSLGAGNFLSLRSEER